MTTEVYYGDICNFCFDARRSTCSTCNLISYCCAVHKIMDSHHKSICIALRNIQNELKCTPNCSFEDFTKYREDFELKLKKKLDSLSFFDKQICEFPWVCVICYSKENLIFPCEKCKAVVYCSLEHKEKDADQHDRNCKNLQLCKIFDSLPYEYGFPFMLQSVTLHEIPRTVKYFPKDIHEYSSLIQKQFNSEITNLNDLINYIKFNDLYAPPTIILYSLNKIGLMDKRKFLPAPDLSKSERQTQQIEREAQLLALERGAIQNFITEPKMVVHIVAASEYEVLLDWTYGIKVITDWLFNVDYVQYFVVGLTMKKLIIPDFQRLLADSEIQMLPKNYKEVAKKLPKPNLVVLFNYGPKKVSTKEFDDRDSQRALFKHKGVPLVVTSTHECVLNNFIEKLKVSLNVIVKVDTHKNPFAEARPYRIWDKKCPTTYSDNSFIAVLVRN
ncbi:hypothetical protein WA026_017094 [Henosepilachna vigintioctopunctata]|uniref:MYND-type domain-containing protein n=1 Tax=Henosepilachna vigintioctopunctata TaxID=420089 RepID=A0AAW1TLH8_9CUCU